MISLKRRGEANKEKLGHCATELYQYCLQTPSFPFVYLTSEMAQVNIWPNNFYKLPLIMN